MPALVKDEYGPTLPELLRGVPRWVQLVAWGAIALLVAAGLWLGSGGASAPERHVVVRGERTFNLAWNPHRLKPVQRPGALLALEGYRGDLFLDSMTIKAATLPAYRGAPGGELAVLGANRLRELSSTAPGFSPSNPQQGRTRSRGASAAAAGRSTPATCGSSIRRRGRAPPCSSSCARLPLRARPTPTGPAAPAR
jgi:hypothetical protein